MANMLAEKF